MRAGNGSGQPPPASCVYNKPCRLLGEGERVGCSVCGTLQVEIGRGDMISLESNLPGMGAQFGQAMESCGESYRTLYRRPDQESR
jgi:hypothetical protein